MQVMQVRDTGNGIPASRHRELFEPFSRLDATQRGIEGTGIGLAISKQLIERMGGQIGFTSEVGIGSTFWIDVPSATRHADDAGQQPCPAIARDQPKLDEAFGEYRTFRRDAHIAHARKVQPGPDCRPIHSTYHRHFQFI
jgi:hypothetical protein